MTVEIGALNETPPEEDPPKAISAASFAPTDGVPIFERTTPLFIAFLLVAGTALIVALVTVHNRSSEEFISHGLGSLRSRIVLSHWLNEGYFHYFGMINRNPDGTSIYGNSSGGYMVSGFIVEKVYSSIFGHYSYRLLAIHNQIVTMIISALAGLLSYRLVRRFDLEQRLAFTAGAAVVIVLFTFPDNLDLFWEMSGQAYGLLFALIYLVIEERSIDRPPPRPRILLLAQGMAMFLMTVMESILALAFVASTAATIAILRRDESWKRFFLVVALPCVAAILLHQLQVKTATARLPQASVSGSNILWRTGLDGATEYYGDHLDIAKRRDLARGNWKKNREYLFRWTWVFILGVTSTIGLLIAFLRGRTPRIMLESLTALAGAWLLYGAVFSQAMVVHPYLYDVLLFTPLSIALFALAPSLLESLTRRTGAFILVIAFAAIWYSFFQLRLYSLRWPLPPPAVEGTATGK